ncbi:deoxyuridine 5'-triphosphate nucleotidohydrolase [Campylobacterota bacterium]|nr:deoxyuridine 5'-triphosphate nucleotidohydrolase [Campylobacterota bacterium]
MANPTLLVKKLDPNAIIPQYHSAEAAGFDLHSLLDYEIGRGERTLVKTGLAVSFAQGYELQVRPRSSLALKHGVTVLNSPGTVDSDYRGELMIILINHGSEPFMIKRGERVAQAVLKAVEQAVITEVDDLDATDRGTGGFGSTGR